jgi:hypothetical protein
MSTLTWTLFFFGLAIVSWGFSIISQIRRHRRLKRTLYRLEHMRQDPDG